MTGMTRTHPDFMRPRAPLRRGEGVSAWRQIADDLEADIAARRLAPGDRLPTEAQLALRFGVNRHTVRRAISVLASRGLVRATQGRGTFVEAAPLPYAIGPKTRFSEIVSRAGREAWGELIASAETAADLQLAEALSIPQGAPLLEMVTVHKADGTPLSMARTHHPLPRFRGLDGHYRAAGSLTRAYACFGVGDYTRRSTRITARLCGPEEAALLETNPGRVVLVIDSVNVDGQGVPIEATRSLFSADRVELVVGS